MSLGILLSPPLNWDYRYEPPQCPVFTGTPGIQAQVLILRQQALPMRHPCSLVSPLKAFVFSCLVPASTSTPSSGPPAGKGDTVPKEPSLPGPTLSFTVFIFLFLTLVFPNFWQQLSHYRELFRLFFLISRFSFFLPNTPHFCFFFLSVSLCPVLHPQAPRCTPFTHHFHCSLRHLNFIPLSIGSDCFGWDTVGDSERTISRSLSFSLLLLREPVVSCVVLGWGLHRRLLNLKIPRQN